MATVNSFLAPNSAPVRHVNDILASLCNKFLFSQGFVGDFLDHGRSVRRLQTEVKSVIRWGDGESLILQGGDVYFQPYSLQLRTRLLGIIKDYKEHCGYYLAIPTQYLASSSIGLRNTKRGKSNDFDIWRVSRFVHWRYFPKKIEYLDAFIFKGSTNDQLREIRKVLSTFSSFVIVSSEPENVDAFFRENLPSAHYSKIIIPAKDAFATYENIWEKVLTQLNELSGVNEQDILLLISAGPCAKVLAYDLIKRGYTAFDVGKLFRCWT